MLYHFWKKLTSFICPFRGASFFIYNFQAQCGSCAAFAAMATIESCFMINNNDMAEDLSEQHILDCAYGHTAVDEE